MLRINQIALFLVPACLGLIVSLWYQLKVFDTRILFVFDSAHYLLTSSQLLSILQSFCQGNFVGLAALRSPDFVSNIMLDGPVIPLLGALSFFLSGQQAAATSWLVIASALSAINAFSAGALAILSSRLFSSKLFCLAIGLFFAFSPATIVSSGRFLTEPISTFLLLLLCLTCSHLVSLQSARASSFWAFAAGLLAATGFLTKAALVPGWFGLLLLSFYCRKRTNHAIAAAILASVCGAFLVLSAWGVFSLVSSGQLTLMPQRMPAFNLATGNNIEIDGRATMPVAASTERYVDKGSSLAVLIGAWSEHPGQLANLYLRKIPRVMGFVWNDFKQVVFGLDISSQNFIHGIVLSLGAIGLFFMISELAASSGVITASRQYLLLATVALIAIHALFYLPFEAIVRYASTVQPFIVLAGAYGLISLFTFGLRAFVMGPLILGLVFILKLDVNSPWLLALPLGDALALLAGLRVLALCSVYGYLLWLIGEAKNACRPRPGFIALLTFLFLSLIVAPVLATTLFQDDQRECQLELKPAQRLVRDLIVPVEGSSTSDFYAVYIDCDARGQDAQFLFNGVPLASKAISVNKIDSSHYFLFNIMRMYASVFDTPTEQMRQWRIVEIPLKLLQGAVGKKQRLSVVAGGTGLTIYGDRLSKNERSIRLPDRGFFCANRFANDGTSLESRILTLDLTAIAAPAAQLFDGERGSLYLSLWQPRLYLLKAVSKSEYSTTEAGEQSFRVKLSTKQFDRVLGTSGSLASGAEDVLKIDRYTFQLARSMGATIPLPREFARLKQAEISLEGKICSIGRANKAGVFLVLHGSKSESAPQTLAASPPFILCQKDWTKFEIRDHVFLPKYMNDQTAITVSLFPGRWEQFSQYGADRTVGSFLVKDLVLSVKSLPDNDLAKCKIEIY